MSGPLYTRRQAVQLGLSGLGSLALLDLAACGSSPSTSVSHETLQLSFWGNTSRNKLTRNAIQAYQQKHSNITINSWYADFTTYFNKLNTQLAGGTAPDLIQMDMSYLSEYDKEHLLLDLTPYINDKTIDITGFDQGMQKSSEDHGVPYGISLGGNYECMAYDTNLVQQTSVGAPPANMTWAEFGTYAGQLSKALAAQKIVGVVDASGYMDLFEIWVRQSGKELWTSDGKVNFTANDVAAWFNYWSGLRSSGACASAELQASVTGSGASTSLLTKGKAVFDITHSNQFVGFQLLSKHTLAFQQIPTGPGPGIYLKPSMLLSIAASSKYVKDSATFINFLINDPAGIRAIALDRGVPGKLSSQTVLQPVLATSDKNVLTYYNMVTSSGISTPKTVLDPPGVSKIITILGTVAQQVGFGKLSVTAGAQSFVQQAQQALA
jgi:multiple sugar transport system substrate-binding protein